MQLLPGVSAKADQEVTDAKAKAKEAKSTTASSGGGSRSTRHDKSVVEKVISSQPVKSFARQAGREIGNVILRSIFGTRRR